MVFTTEIGTTPLAELITQVQAGHEVLLTDGDKPVARLVAPLQVATSTLAPLNIPTFKGHCILTPNISQEEMAESMFNRQ